MKNINKNILQNNEDIDTIHALAQKALKSAFKTNTIKTKIFTPLVHPKDSVYIDQFIDLALYVPMDIDYLKWNPEYYYSKIDCPTLMLFAEKDITIDIKGSIENSKKIVNTHKKQIFQLLLFPM